MSSMGVKIENFSVPVCNSFQPKILNDQICYEVDLNRYANKDNIDKNLKLGLSFMMDYNEDRQVTFQENLDNEKDFSMTSSIVELDQSQQAFIYLNTVGKSVFYFRF